MREQINEQLILLEQELSRLKSVTDYIDNTKEMAQEVVETLRDIQEKYAIYTDEIYELYKNSIDELTEETEGLVKETLLRLEATGNQIDSTNREKLVEIRRLLVNYRETVEATDRLVDTLRAVNFPMRFNMIEDQINAGLNDMDKQFDIQDRNSTTIKVLLFIGIVIGIVNIVMRFI